MFQAPHFLMLVGDLQAAKSCYIEKLNAVGATYNIIETPEELHELPRKNGFHGMMLDVHSVVRLSGTQRAAIKEYALVLPTLKLFLDPKTREMVVNQSNIDEICPRNFDSFVKICTTLPARSIRREKRYQTYLNVVQDNHRANITDISRRGCFIMTTETSHLIGEEMYISIVELQDQTLIRCIVRNKVEWGNKYVAAGIGVEFASMTDQQQSELDTIVTEYAEQIENSFL